MCFSSLKKSKIQQNVNLLINYPGIKTIQKKSILLMPNARLSMPNARLSVTTQPNCEERMRKCVKCKMSYVPPNYTLSRNLSVSGLLPQIQDSLPGFMLQRTCIQKETTLFKTVMTIYQIQSRQCKEWNMWKSTNLTIDYLGKLYLKILKNCSNY